MPNVKEHKEKYLENKYILEKVFNPKEEKHRNWYMTVTFYAALHIIDMQFADLGRLQLGNHVKREEEMLQSDAFPKKICTMYKFLSDYSRVARYDAGCIEMTILNRAMIYLQKIEEEYLTTNKAGDIIIKKHEP